MLHLESFFLQCGEFYGCIFCQKLYREKTCLIKKRSNYGSSYYYYFSGCRFNACLGC